MTLIRSLFVTTLVLILSGCSAMAPDPAFLPSGQNGAAAGLPGGNTLVPPPVSPVSLSGATREVGPGKPYATLTAAVVAAGSGDVIAIAPGIYTDDFPQTISKSLVIKGVGGMAKFTTTQTVPNRKAILVVNADVMLENLDISTARVSDADGANAAAIRHEGGDLLVYRCDLHDNQNGIMGAAGSGEVVVHTSRLAKNGVSDAATYPSGHGYTHNVYLAVSKLSIINSYVWAANAGHNVKSRSDTTVIQHSIIADGADGTASYSVDVPNGGHLRISKTWIQKGPLASNRPFISFGMEGLTRPAHSITVSDSSFVNDLGAAVVIANGTGISASLSNNVFYRLTDAQLGPATVVDVGSTFSNTAPYAPADWGTSPPSMGQ